MHLSAGFSRVCVRERIEGQSDHQKTNLTHGWGDGDEPPVKKRKASGV